MNQINCIFRLCVTLVARVLMVDVNAFFFPPTAYFVHSIQFACV